jgi:RNA polymerase sigma factor (TIGR02999 family)
MTDPEAKAPGAVTALLGAARQGDASALDRVVALLYDDLRRVADRQLAREHAPRSIRPTELVHEAFFRLAAGDPGAANDRSHFIALAARAMRQVLVDQARHRGALKRGSEFQRTTLTEGVGRNDLGPDELIALDDAMARLTPRQQQIVECRFFGGLEEEEIAAALGISSRTVRRDWVAARAWLYRALYGDSA